MSRRRATTRHRARRPAPPPRGPRGIAWGRRCLPAAPRSAIRRRRAAPRRARPRRGARARFVPFGVSSGSFQGPGFYLPAPHREDEYRIATRKGGARVAPASGAKAARSASGRAPADGRHHAPRMRSSRLGIARPGLHPCRAGAKSERMQPVDRLPALENIDSRIAYARTAAPRSGSIRSEATLGSRHAQPQPPHPLHP